MSGHLNIIFQYLALLWMWINIIVEKHVGVTAMVGRSENKDNVPIPTHVPTTPSITGNI